MINMADDQLVNNHEYILFSIIFISNTNESSIMEWVLFIYFEADSSD